MEVWKDIPGFEAYYQASTFGRIKRKSGFTRNQFKEYPIYERILKPLNNGRGYLSVNLSAEGTSIREYIHRLVVKTFLPNPNNYPEVNHIDGDKSNNSLANLEWCDRLANQRHAKKAGLFKPKNHWGKKNPNYKHGRKAIYNIKRKCPICGKEFITKTIKSICCSKSCHCNYVMNNNRSMLSYLKSEAQNMGNGTVRN